MSGFDAPVIWDRFLHTETDNIWRLRRLDSNHNPVIPTSAKAQIRGNIDGEIWVNCTVKTNLETGWITIIISKSDVTGPEWLTRKNGIWDLLVEYGDNTFKWAKGAVIVDRTVRKRH